MSDTNPPKTTSYLYSPNKDRHFFACTLRDVMDVAALGVPRETYFTDLLRRNVEFVTCLISGQDSRYTYDLRIISSPDPDFASRGEIVFAILCRMGVPLEDAAHHPRNLLRLLNTSFDEHDFELMSETEVEKLLCPFQIAHVIAVNRRCSRELLDTLRSGIQVRPRPGFAKRASPEPPQPDSENDTILHVFPYLPPPPSDGLLKLLLVQRAPIAISCRLRPTALTSDEESFLEQQIAKCELYAQDVGLMSGKLSALVPTLREQARIYQQYQARLLFGLRDNAALMTIEIASPEPIPETVADTLGAAVTQPAGGTEAEFPKSMFGYFSGGFEVVALDAAGGAVAFQQLDLKLPPHSIVPAVAERLPYLFDSVEATAGFRLPPATLDEHCGIEVKHWRDHPPGRTLASSGVLIGESVHYGIAQPVHVGREDRQRHIYAVGQTGTGKTTLLKTLILDDIRSGQGICVIDPHGDLYRELLGKIPQERLDDVVLLDPTDVQWPVGLNLLEYETESQRHFIIQEFVSIIGRMVEDEFGFGALREFAGPLFFQHLRMNLLLAMSRQKDPGTLLEFHAMYQDNVYWKRWLPLEIDDVQLKRWVTQVLPNTDYLMQGRDSGSMGGYISSKFENFVFDPMLRNIFGQKHSTLDLRKIMDTGKILLVNLAKGELTDTNSRFLGMLLLAKLQAAAMGRVKLAPEERRRFYVYVDEFQAIATQSFITLVSEARKFGLSLVLANQFVSQIKDVRIAEAIFGNVGTLICFRLGQADAEIMEKEMSPVVGRSDLMNLPNWHAYMNTLVNGQATRPFTIRTIPSSGLFDPQRAKKVQELSRSKYGRPRYTVEQEIGKALAASA